MTDIPWPSQKTRAGSSNSGALWSDQTAGTPADTVPFNGVACDATGQKIVALDGFADIWTRDLPLSHLLGLTGSTVQLVCIAPVTVYVLGATGSLIEE